MLLFPKMLSFLSVIPEVSLKRHIAELLSIVDKGDNLGRGGDKGLLKTTRQSPLLSAPLGVPGGSAQLGLWESSATDLKLPLSSEISEGRRRSCRCTQGGNENYQVASIFWSSSLNIP